MGGAMGVAAMEEGGLRLGVGMESATTVVAAKAIASNVVEIDRVAIGYNHNIPYGGRVYHVQTEDSGRTKGHIFTHVFHAGTIVASNKVGYDRAARVSSIVELARASHKLMMRKLVHGMLDEGIARCLGGSQAGEILVEDRRAKAPALEVVDPLAEPAADENDENDAPDERCLRIRALIEALDMDGVLRTLEGLRSNVAGTLGIALVDYESGMCLGSVGAGIDVETAAAGSMEVMKAKAKVMRALGIAGGIEDMLITLESQYHIIRPVGTALFLYLAMDRPQGNLALARHRLTVAAAELHVSA
jgi:predicted regulator of Ras-like GTPase activity (Roadblock/LC7/MglB family)